MRQQMSTINVKRLPIFQNLLFDNGKDEKRTQSYSLTYTRNSTDRERYHNHTFLQHSERESKSKPFNRLSEPRKKIFSLTKLAGHIQGSRSQASQFSQVNSASSRSQERRYTIFGRYDINSRINPENKVRVIEKLTHLVDQFQKSQIQIIEDKPLKLKQTKLIGITSADKGWLSKDKKSTEHHKTSSVSCKQIMSPQELAQLIIKIKTGSYNKKPTFLNNKNLSQRLKLKVFVNNSKGEGENPRQTVLSDKIS